MGGMGIDTDDTYKGESPSKKIARLTYWMIVRSLLGPRFLRDKHLVLASREAGDVSVLLGLGVPPVNIVAVDTNQRAIEIARAKFPQVRFVVDDVAAVARGLRRRGQRAHAFLDFCSQLTPRMHETVFTVCQHAVPDNGLCGVNLLRGREKGIIADILQDEDVRHFHREFRRVSIESGLSNAEGDVGEVFDRDMLLLQWLSVRSISLGWAPVYIGEMHYQSSTTTSRGVPMMGALFEVVRGPNKTGKRSIQKLHKRIIKSLERYADKIEFYTRIRATEDDVRTRAIELSRPRRTVRCGVGTEWFDWEIPGYTAALLLNVSERTLAAWKAHATRGTYDDMKLA